MDIKKAVESLKDELIALRRDFHMHPELGYEEYRTSAIVKDYLKNCGLEVRTVAKTGVVGLLRGKTTGPTVLLRADMDALAQTEQTDVPYKSLFERKMHACGHDGHTAILLVVAKILASYKDNIKGNIKFVFQPNEETAGALDMINEGILEDPHVDAAFGLHLWTPLKSGTIGLVNGTTMAACEQFDLTVIGKSGHTSAPHSAIDPIIIAASILQNIQVIQTRETSVLSPTTIMAGEIHGGTARNIIADQVTLSGTIRFLSDDAGSGKLIKEKFERIIQGTCNAMGAKYELQYIPSNLAVINAAAMVELVKHAVKDTFCDENVIVPYACMAGDDFAEFAQRVPSVYYFVGTGNKETCTDYPHHHSKFNIDESTLSIGVELQIRSALAFLNR
jgi:amidohydrolase